MASSGCQVKGIFQTRLENVFSSGGYSRVIASSQFPASIPNKQPWTCPKTLSCAWTSVQEISLITLSDGELRLFTKEFHSLANSLSRFSSLRGFSVSAEYCSNHASISCDCFKKGFFSFFSKDLSLKRASLLCDFSFLIFCSSVAARIIAFNSSFFIAFSQVKSIRVDARTKNSLFPSFNTSVLLGFKDGLSQRHNTSNQG